ncbi:hypothetical protein NY2A_b265R [Paramecium bursaria Chlorella virus NY2A]|uniref:Uncharacterized protein b265R n=1 Tax=Paramecium bursaria Chlorella virus NY2A TaxID=46021 RepID=A7IWE0_PBCVN|nr:hypothetical protein NY2A_b265R [Paramecium bursaria Chlorella virus NY2A]ABT14664.1 hypothetical protein NY2A_b265R [Paramecium bursaria Chlorella virus NY2A]
MIEQMFQLSFDGVFAVSFIISSASYIHGILVGTCRNRRIKTSHTTEIGSLVLECRYEYYRGKCNRDYAIDTH